MRPTSPEWMAGAHRMANFTPNPVQRQIISHWVNSDSRAIGILGGERAGKSLVASFLALLAMGIPPEGAGEVTIETGENYTVGRMEHVDQGHRTYWVVGPDYNQCRPEWSYLYESYARVGFVLGEPSMPASGSAPWTFKTIFGDTITTRSSAEVAKLASFSVHGIIMAEAAQQPHEVYLKCLGRISESRGFLILVGTLERGLPWYQDLYQRWQGANPLDARFFSLPTWTNTHIYPGGRQDPEILRLEAEYPEDYFLERFGAEPRKAFDAVIPEFSFEKHVRRLEYDPNVPVELWVDPGQQTYAVLFVQCVGLYTHILDRVYTHGQIVHAVIPQVMGNRLFQHVVKTNAGVIDIAGKQEYGNKSQTTLWRELAGCSFRYQYRKLEDSIATVRFRMSANNIHHEPLVFFNDHITNLKSPDGMALDVLAEFELWKWPNRHFKQNEPKKPIEKNNHAIMAVAYGLQDHYGEATVQRPSNKRPSRKRDYWGIVIDDNQRRNEREWTRKNRSLYQ